MSCDSVSKVSGVQVTDLDLGLAVAQCRSMLWHWSSQETYFEHPVSLWASPQTWILVQRKATEVGKVLEGKIYKEQPVPWFVQPRARAEGRLHGRL